jgi:hypothetical protein
VHPDSHADPDASDDDRWILFVNGRWPYIGAQNKVEKLTVSATVFLFAERFPPNTLQ